MDTDLEKKEYEIAFLLDSAEAEAEITNLLAKIKAEVTTAKPISEISLAYPIKKHTSAYFGFIRFKAMTNEVAEVKAALRHNAKVLRSLVTVYIPVKLRAIRTRSVERAAESTTTAIAKKEPSVGSTGAVSNEELEKTLEEILK
ncbi:MAG: 30S ribosomal protein S6 [Parcubacteria group bacterium Gr01-1014_3]|nr:MAG: 30S ribosomal protein S6 [Parcubacteria group bacterium Gr01-1014_3]